MTATGPGSTSLYNVTYSYADRTTGKDTDLIKKLTNNANGHVTTYDHDGSDRLTARLTKNGATTVESYGFTYDNASNRLTETVGSTTTHFTYDPQNRLCRKGSTAGACPTSSYPYTYDGNGNQLTGNSHTFSYNNKNQTTVADGNWFFYLDADQTQRTETNDLYFVNWIQGMESTSPISGPDRYYGRTPDGMLIYTADSNNAVHYYLRDGEKNVIGLTNSSGARTATFTYAPYGAATTATGADAAKTILRYKQGLLDPNGLYKFGTRYYDPTDAHWTQRDPLAGAIASPATINRYAYVGGNPIDNWDPTGRDWWNPTTWNDCESSTAQAVGTVGATLGGAVFAPVSAGTSVALAAGVVASLGTVSQAENDCA